MNRFVLVGTGKDYVKYVWQSVVSRDDVQWFDRPFLTSNAVLYNICHLHSSFLLNKFFSLPFKSLWRKFYSIENATIKGEDRYFIILFDNTLCRYSPKSISKFKIEHPNAVLVLFMDNAMYKKERLVLSHLKNVDLVYTNNKYDAEKYGFKYVFNIIPPQQEQLEYKPDYDVVFVGNAYDRLNIIHAVYDRLESIGLRIKMYVSGTRVRRKDRRKEIVYNRNLNYNEVIDLYNRSGCLLEVVGEKPTMLTMRTMEALIRNKKLITNHPFIKEQSFYDSRYIRFFKDENDLDADFFTKNQIVEYNFVNDYTPEKFLERVLTDYSLSCSEEKNV